MKWEVKRWWILKGGSILERGGGGGVVLSKSTCKGLLLRGVEVLSDMSEVGRGSVSTTIFHNAIERRATPAAAGAGGVEEEADD